VISAIKRGFTRYGVNYDIAKRKARIEKEKFNKDGSLSKQVDVYYRCNMCGQEVKETVDKKTNINIDHIDPVIPIDKQAKDMKLDEIFDRTDCSEDNLQLLCKKCHNEKTALEKKLRKKTKVSSKKADKSNVSNN
jgi:5-methylcytosine-specific restriction endonuclease McrA